MADSYRRIDNWLHGVAVGDRRGSAASVRVYEITRPDGTPARLVWRRQEATRNEEENLADGAEKIGAGRASATIGSAPVLLRSASRQRVRF